jgi:hypothetical protein
LKSASKLLCIAAVLITSSYSRPALARTAGGHTVPTYNNFCGQETIVIPVEMCNIHDPGTGIKMYGAKLQSGTFIGCNDSFVPSATHSPGNWNLAPGECGVIEFTLTRPAILDTVSEACLWVMIIEIDGPTTGLGIFVTDVPYLNTCLGWDFYEAEWARFIHPLDPVTQQIDLMNMGPVAMDLQYEILVRGEEGAGMPDAVALNNQEPGMSVTGQVVLDPGVTTPLGFELMWLSRDLPGPYEMVVMADTDGDGTDEELGSMAVHNADFMAPGGEPVSETGVTPRQLADAMHLELRPNPFNPSTQLSFELAQTAPTTVEILDLRGRVVRTLVAKESFDAGSHSLHWNGRDDRGSVVASGVYQVRVQAGEQVAILKATLLK